MVRHDNEPGRRRAVYIGVAMIILLGWLLWPLSSRRWEISLEPDTSAKDEYLAAERAVAKRAGMAGTGAARRSPATPVRPPTRVVLIVADDLAQMDVSRYGDSHTAPHRSPRRQSTASAVRAQPSRRPMQRRRSARRRARRSSPAATHSAAASSSSPTTAIRAPGSSISHSATSSTPTT